MSQSAGDGSTNLQAQNIYVSGVTATEARQIALDVYRANFSELSRAAKDTAAARAEEITDAFIEKLTSTASSSFDALQTPGLQLALLAAQTDYARTGDKDAQELLVSLLVQRAQQRERDLRQIAVEEAVPVVSKLTQKQVDILTLSTLVQDHYFAARSERELRQYLSSLTLFAVTVGYDSPDIAHLEFTGCARVSTEHRHNDLAMNLQRSYPGLFATGFSMDEFQSAIPSWERYASLLTTCFHSPELWQINSLSTEGINKFFADLGLEAQHPDKKALFDLQKSSAMNVTQVKEYLLRLEPRAEFVFKSGSYQIFKLNITPVGIAIACANYLRKTGMALPWPYRMRDI